MTLIDKETLPVDYEQSLHKDREIDFRLCGRIATSIFSSLDLKWEYSYGEFYQAEKDPLAVEERGGELKLLVNTNDGSISLTGRQIKSIRYFLENEQDMFREIMRDLVVRIDEFEIFSDVKPPEDGEEWFLPGGGIEKHISGDNLYDMMRLDSIIIARSEGRDISPIVFEFSCGWDPEHGVSIVLYKSKVVEVGSGADFYDL